MTSRNFVESASPSSQAETDWDSALLSIGGHLLQSWRWGEFKSRHGWAVERIAVGGQSDAAPALAQILFQERGPYALGYIPRGATIGDGSPQTARQLFFEIDSTCRKRRCISLIVEPESPLPFPGRYKDHGFVRGPEHIQPARTVIVPLLDDDALLAQMRQKTRYSVRLAERRGVEIRRHAPYDGALRDFYALLRETSDRNDFGIHAESYYGDFVQIFGERAFFVMAYVEGVPAAGLIAARFGKSAIYMYGASSTEHRAHGAAFALQFEAMRWARDHGCETYDLWGIPLKDPEPATPEAERVAATRGDDRRGLYRFKTGFGGELVSYPPTLERRYRPMLSFLARRIYGHRGS